MDESNATCGKRLDSIGVENTEDNRCAQDGPLATAPSPLPKLCLCPSFLHPTWLHMNDPFGCTPKPDRVLWAPYPELAVIYLPPNPLALLQARVP